MAADAFDSWASSPARNDDDDDEVVSVQASPRKSQMRGKGRRDLTPRRRGGVKKDGKMKEKKPRNPEQPKECYVQGCDAKAKPKNKCCVHHFNILGCLHKQAKKSNNLDAYQHIVLCPIRTREACDAFDAENPPGATRKNLVEWGHWRKRFGVRAAIVQRQGEELMGMNEFIEREKKKGASQQQAEADWNSRLERGADGEGEGPLRKLWIEENKKRYREKTHYEDQGWDEGSAVKKGATPEEREKMKNWAAESSTFGSTFLLKANQASASSGVTTVSATAAQMEADAKANVEVGLAAPALHKALTKDLKALKTSFNSAVTANKKAQESYNELVMSCGEIPSDMTAYHDLVVCRLWLAEHVLADAPMQVTPPTSLRTVTLPPVPTSVGGARSASRSKSQGHGNKKHR